LLTKVCFKALYLAEITFIFHKVMNCLDFMGLKIGIEAP